MSTASGQVTLMIISEGGRAPVSIKFSRTTFRIILGALGFAVVALIAVLATYGILLTHSIERTRLAVEVQQLQRYSAKVDQLEKNLANYRSMLKKMTELAGIDLSATGLMSLDSQYASDHQQPSPENVGTAPNSQPQPTPQGYPVKGYMSRSYRPEDDNPLMRHYGIDLAVGVGTPVTVTADGIVSFAGWDSTFGKQVVVTHPSGLETIYGHNDSLLVQVGELTKYGEAIAISGNTGVSTAPHVHYEIRKNGVPINPEDYLDKQK